MHIVFVSNLKIRIYQIEIKECTISRTKNQEKKNKQSGTHNQSKKDERIL